MRPASVSDKDGEISRARLSEVKSGEGKKKKKKRRKVDDGTVAFHCGLRDHPPTLPSPAWLFSFFLTHSIALKTESRTTKVSVFYHLFHQLLTPLETSINIQCVCLKLNFYFALLSIDSYIQRVGWGLVLRCNRVLYNLFTTNLGLPYLELLKIGITIIRHDNTLLEEGVLCAFLTAVTKTASDRRWIHTPQSCEKCST